MIPVRQSTAFETAIGPVLDADGVAVTGGVVADFKIKKTTGNFAALNGSATLTHVSAGFYDLVLTTSDTDTVGLACIAIDDTTNCCAPLYLQVVEEAVYDAMFAASAGGYLQPTVAGRTLDVTATGAAGIDWANVENPTTALNLSGTNFDVDQVVASVSGAVGSVTGNVGGNVTGSVGSVTGAVGSVTGNVSGNVTGSVGSVASGGITAASFAADAMARLGIVAYGTAQSATSTTLVLASSSAFANDELNGAVLVITGGSAGVGQSRVITDSVLSTDTVTVDAWTTTPTGTITYVIFAAPPASATALPAVNVTQFGGAAGTFSGGRPEVNTTHVGGTSQTAGNLASLITTVDTVVDAILDDTGTAGVVVASGSKTGYSLTATTGLGNQTADITGNLSGSVGSVTGAVGSVTGNVGGNVTGSVGSVTGAVGSVTGNVGGNVTGSVGSVATGGLTAASLASDAGAEIADAVLDRAITEPSGVFAWGSASLRAIIQLVGAMARNKQTQTATTYTLRNDADSGTIATATVSDDGTTTTKGELS